MMKTAFVTLLVALILFEPTQSEESIMEHSLANCNALNLTQLGIDIETENVNDFVTSLSLSADGKIVAIGVRNNDGNGPDSGHTRVYEYNDDESRWTQLGGDIDGEGRYDYSGDSVSLSTDGKTVAIGASYNYGNGDSSGHVRVYGYSDSSGWTQLGNDINGESAYDNSGRSVSLSADGKTVAIGALYNDGNGNGSGHVRIYGYSNSSGWWTQLGDDIDGESTYDNSGDSVSLSADGKTVAIGAPYNDGNGGSSGHVRIYGLSDSSGWVQLGSDIDGESAGDYSGWSVSLSADGKAVAIGASNNDGNGYNSGHVRVYGYSNSSGWWTQLGDDIDGEGANDDSGRSVSLSADGKTVAIGAPFNDGNGGNSGHVRVYGYSNSSGWTQLGDDIDGEDNSGWSVSLSADGKTVAIGAKGYTRLFSIQCNDKDTPSDIELGTNFVISEPNLVTYFHETPGQHGGEIVLSYNITTPNTCDTTFSVRIYKEGCTNYTEHSQYIDVLSTKVDDTTTPQNNYGSCIQGNQTLDVSLDIKESTITASPFFQFTDSPVNSSGEVKFCQRLMLSYDIDKDGELPTGDQEFYEVVHFQETDVKLDLDFSQMFSVGDIDLEHNSIATKADTASVESNLNVYQCNGTTGDDISDDNDQNKIAPGSVVSICFSTNSTNMGIREVRSLSFHQETTGIYFDAITDGNPNPITISGVDKATTIPNKKWRVLSQLILPFFDSTLGGVDYDVTASGTIIMQYQDDVSTRRYLRKAQKEGPLSRFEIKLRLTTGDKQLRW